MTHDITTHFKFKKWNGFKQWGKGNNNDVDLNIINHYEKHVNSGDEDWDKYLPVKSVEAYKNFALEKSKIMTNRIVHTNGCKVYLSGIYENVLIIGRLDENNQLGISSCYIIHDYLFQKKLDIFNRNQCFTF